MIMDLTFAREHIPCFKNAEKLVEIKKGFSLDKKYMVQNEDGEKYLLRTATIDKASRKQTEYSIIKEMKNLQVKAPVPIEIGTMEDLGLCFYILTYIEGEDAREMLPTLTEEQQYIIGFRAGEDMAKINQYPASEEIEPWYDRCLEKYLRYLDAYQTCGIKLRNVEKITSFIDSNLHLIQYRPNFFQHDDFHVGNLIVSKGQYAGVIDFDRYDWGDPYFDFVKLGLFSSEVSIPFAKGQVHGYFKNGVPDDFWTLYSVYMAMTIFPALVWTVNFTPENIKEMTVRVDLILDEHEYFEKVIPKWFSE